MDGADREISSNQIGEIVMEHLQALDAVAYVRFASVYREFKDVSTFMEELKNLWNHNPQEIKILKQTWAHCPVCLRGFFFF